MEQRPGQEESARRRARLALAQKFSTDVIAAVVARSSGNNSVGGEGECEAPSGRQSPADVHAAATAAVSLVVGEAVQDVTQAVVITANWLTQAVRGELVSQAVAGVVGGTNATGSADGDDVATLVVSSIHTTSSLPNADVRAVAEAVVDAAATEALRTVLRSVNEAPLSMAVDVVAGARDTVDSPVLARREEREEEPVHAHTAAASALVADANVDAVSPLLEPHSLEEDDVDPVHAVTQAAVALVVNKALKDVTLAVDGATEWFAHAVRNELLAKAVAEAANKNDMPTTATDAMPTLPLPSPDQAARDELSSTKTTTTCHQLAQIFVQQVISNAVQRSLGAEETEGEEVQQQVTPRPSLLASLPEQDEEEKQEPNPVLGLALELEQVSKVELEPKPSKEWEPTPIVIALVEQTPLPERKRTSRRKSPTASPRDAHNPAFTSKTSASAPPTKTTTAQTLPKVPPRLEGTSSPESLSQPSLLPPLKPSGVRTPLSGNAEPLLHHKLSQRTPRPSQQQSPRREAEPKALSTPQSSPRTATSTSRSPREKRMPSTAGELEMTPLSSARAAARIYAEQPQPTPRCKHHRKPPQCDAATQTSARMAPSSLTPSSHHTHSANNNGDGDQNEARAKRVSTRDHELRSGTVRGKPTTLLPLAKVPSLVTPESTTTKSTSPVRDKKAQDRTRRHREGGGGGSPSKMRSGYCQRCVFEGRSCKINDCLKHQLLK